MNAAPAAPTSNAAVPTLPADLAALLDARGELSVVHPATGEPVRLVPVAAGGGDDDRPLTPAERAELDGGQTDLEAIREGLAEADAGALMSRAEFRAAMAARHPRLRGR